MADFGVVVAFALLPALGNFAGGLLAEATPISPASLSLALHGAAGVVVGIVALEIMPEALEVTPAWAAPAAFVVGGIAFVGIDAVTEHVSARWGSPGAATPWALYTGVAIDLFSDGVMIGAGSSLSLGTGLLLSLGQVTADVPEGFATAAAFKAHGMPRGRRLLLLASFVVPILLGATAGYLGLQGRPEWMKLALLAFTAGVLMTLVVEEIGPEVHREKEGRMAALVFVLGFAAFATVSFLLNDNS